MTVTFQGQCQRRHQCRYSNKMVRDGGQRAGEEETEEYLSDTGINTLQSLSNEGEVPAYISHYKLKRQTLL